MAILVVAAGLRVAANVERERWPLTADEADWERQGLIYATHGLGVEDAGAYRSPLFPMLIGAVYASAGSETLYVRYTDLLLSLFAVTFVFRLAARLPDGRAPAVAAAVAAVYPLWLSVNASIVSETVVVAAVTGAALAAIRMHERPTLPRGLVFGLALAACALSGLTPLLWCPIVAVVLLVGIREGAPKDRLNRVAAVACGILVVVAPWTVRNEVVAGDRMVLPMDTGMRLLIGHEPRANGTRRDRTDYYTMYERMTADAYGPAEQERSVVRQVARWAADEPLRALTLAGRKTYHLWNSVLPDAPPRTRTLHFVTGVLISGFGLIGLFRERRTPIGIVGLTVVGVWTVSAAVFYASPQMRLPVDFVLAPFAATAALATFDRVRKAVIDRFRELEAA